MVWVIRAIWGLGGLLLLGGMVVIVRAFFADRARGRHRCPTCWYEMTGISGLRCPECGRLARTESALQKTRRRPWRAVLGVVLILLSVIVWRVPVALQTGWWSAVPNLGLALILQVTDNDDVFQRVQARMEKSPLNRVERYLLARHCAQVLAKPDALVSIPTSASRLPGTVQEEPPDERLTDEDVQNLIAASALPRAWPSQRHAEAFRVLARLGPSARPAVPILIELLNNRAERSSALTAIASIGPGAGRAIEPLLSLFADPTFVDYEAAFTTLRSIRASTDRTLDVAVRYIEGESDLFGKITAVAFLVSVFPAERVRLTFEHLLTRPEMLVRLAGARGLERLGKAGVPSIPLIVIATRDRRCGLQAAGVNVLASFREDAIAALADLCNDADPEVSRPAAAALGTLGSLAAPAIPALVLALDSSNPFVLAHAANSLQLIGTGEAIEQLRRIAQEADSPRAAAARGALQRQDRVPG